MLNAEKALTNNNLFRTLLPESGFTIICIEKDFSKVYFYLEYESNYKS
jgi:hypothetical protein